MQKRESLEFDVLIVGAGPAGLSAAIRLAQLSQEKNWGLSICILEKGAYVGAHLLSGAVFEPTALNTLIPHWKETGAPLSTPVTEDRFYALTQGTSWRLPLPPSLKNKGNYIISLGALARFLAAQAENLGISIFPGFSGVEILFNADKTRVIGVATGDLGRDRKGKPAPNFTAGIELYAKHTWLAEGCRGSLSQILMQHFQLRKNTNPQTYGIGIKELWEIPRKQHQPGLVIHANGWPLDKNTYGGSFLYHFEENKIALGLIVGLDYQNPYLDPFQELQRLKHHPLFAKTLSQGRCISYGARAVNEGGWQSLPKLSFPGGLLLGCAGGTLNVAKIKGNHTAMQSGILAAETLVETMNASENTRYEKRLRTEWIGKELHAGRNVRPAFRKGYWMGMAYSAMDQVLLRGKAPWTLRNHVDHLSLEKAKKAKPIPYPKPDGLLSFSKLEQVYRSNTSHKEDQPCHLKLKDPNIELTVNINQYDSPESRYCPAAVYEVVESETGNKRLQINFQNCLHCKTCDIKDPTQNIVWTPPEGGGGPQYTDL